MDDLRKFIKNIIKEFLNEQQMLNNDDIYIESFINEKQNYYLALIAIDFLFKQNFLCNKSEKIVFNLPSYNCCLNIFFIIPIKTSINNYDNVYLNNIKSNVVKLFINIINIYKIST